MTKKNKDLFGKIEEASLSRKILLLLAYVAIIAAAMALSSDFFNGATGEFSYAKFNLASWAGAWTSIVTLSALIGAFSPIGETGYKDFFKESSLNDVLNVHIFMGAIVWGGVLIVAAAATVGYIVYFAFV